MKQLATTIQWDSILNVANPYDSIAQMEGSTTIPAKNGMFGFLKPTGEEDLIMKRHFATTGITISDSFFELKPSSEYVVFAFNIPDADGQASSYEIRNALEYETNDVWRQTVAPEYDKSIFDMALSRVKTIPQFHENPTHIKNILNKVGTFLKGVFNAGRTYLPMIEAAGAAFGL